jgi:hypothetical protein
MTISMFLDPCLKTVAFSNQQSADQVKMLITDYLSEKLSQ